jgi:hypothetical protein
MSHAAYAKFTSNLLTLFKFEFVKLDGCKFIVFKMGKIRADKIGSFLGRIGLLMSYAQYYVSRFQSSRLYSVIQTCL